MEPGLILLVGFLVVVGSIVKGLAGFGFGIAATALLTNFLPAEEAVTLMILPLIAVNIPLIIDTEFSKLEKCIERYRVFLVSGVSGTVIGVLTINYLPTFILTVSVGIVSLLYVYLKQDIVYRPFRKNVLSKCFTEKWYNQSLIGAVGGLTFGAANVGLLFVTYLSRIEADRKVFIGLLSSLLLASTVLRAGISYGLGLYTGSLLTISAGLSVLALTVSYLSTGLRSHVPENYLKGFALTVILLAGTRILYIHLF